MHEQVLMGLTQFNTAEHTDIILFCLDMWISKNKDIY